MRVINARRYNIHRVGMSVKYRVRRKRVEYDKDSDYDGLPDDVEWGIGSNPYSADSDGDGRSDTEEYLEGRNPLNPEDEQ